MKNRAVFARTGAGTGVLRVPVTLLGTSVLVASLLVASLLVALLLAGCTAKPAPTGPTRAPASQSKTAACKNIGSELFVVNDGLAKYTPSIGSDPIDTAGFITALAKRFSKAANLIGNEEVRAPSLATAAQLTGFAHDITEYAHNPTDAQQKKVIADGKPVQAAINGIQTVCGG